MARADFGAWVWVLDLGKYGWLLLLSFDYDYYLPQFQAFDTMFKASLDASICTYDVRNSACGIVACAEGILGAAAAGRRS